MDSVIIDENIIDNAFLSCCSSSDSFYSADSDESSEIFSAHERLCSAFSSFRNNFNVVHVNAQSIPCHHTDLLDMFSDSPVDAILVSESWLKPSLLSTSYAIPGYKLIRNDRVGKSGGGVAVYLRGDIVAKIVSVSPNHYSGSAEHLFVEVTLHHKKVLLCVVYSPSLRVDYFSALESLLATHCPNYDYTIIAGDFNTCLLKSDLRASKLRALFSCLNLSILPLSATHHAPNITPSLLDLLITSSPDLIDSFGQFPSTISHHDLIFLSFKIRPARRKTQFTFSRSFKDINLEALKRDMSEIDWSLVYFTTDIDQKVAIMTGLVTAIFDKHAPVKRIKIKHVPAPWLTQDLINIMAKRNRALCRYRKRPTDENFAKYKYLRNRCSRLCRDAKRRHIHSSIDQSNPSQLWKFLSTLGIGKTASHFDNNSFSLNDLNVHFSTSPVLVDQTTKAHTISHLDSLPRPSCCPLLFKPVTEDEVLRHARAITSTAEGSDNLSPRMISLILPELLPILTHILNYSLTTSSFPSAWKCANVIPLPKTSNPTSLSQFRPISILPYLSKVLEHIVHNQISQFLTLNNLLSPFQSGFRPGHSTVTALLKVTDDIRLAMENICISILVLLDFSSAFNSVDFDILLSVLRSLNISSSVLDWFDSYLRGRSQRVRSDEAFSDWCDVEAGVPQGGVLSPLLFSIFINTVSKLIASNFHLYADDLQIYRHSLIEDIISAIAEINADLQRIAEWAKSFGLRVNPGKSQAMIIGSKYKTQRVRDAPSIVYNGTIIPFTDTAKNLGLILDNNLSWITQVSEVSKKVYYSLHKLKCLQNFLPMKTKILLVQTHYPSYPRLRRLLLLGHH